jgi:hypothetical protein
MPQLISPCPVCASVHVVVVEAAQAICLDCGLTGPRGLGRIGAIAAWNTRAALPSKEVWSALPAGPTSHSLGPADPVAGSLALSA